jgi:hypothetical protein
MAWLAFAAVPTMFVVMLAMGQLEERLLPQTPPRTADDDDDAIRAGAALYWEIPAAAPAAAPVAAAAAATAPAAMVEGREEAGT